jgi:hypothetical protein
VRRVLSWRVIPIVEGTRVAAGPCVDDADVVGAPTAGAAAHPRAQLGDAECARQALQQFRQVDAHHASTVDAHGEQFEMGGEFRHGLHTG